MIHALLAVVTVMGAWIAFLPVVAFLRRRYIQGRLKRFEDEK